MKMSSSAAAAMGVSDPSQLHLKKELTQIRKAARVLRDPGTTSSWRSPLASSSRSVGAAAAAAAAAASATTSSTWNNNGNSTTPTGNRNNGSVKRVFLHNWKSSKSSRNNDNDDDDYGDGDYDDYDDDDDDDGIDASSSVAALSVDDSLSDARTGADGDSRSDTQTYSRSSSMMLRRRYAHLLPPVKNTKKTSKKTDTHSDVLSKYQQKELILGRNLVSSRKSVEGHPSMAVRSGRTRDDLVDQSDDTEDYCNSEDLRRISGASPLLSKLKKKNWSKFRRENSIRREDSSYSYSTPALSTSSYNRYHVRNPSTVGSWDGTTTSMNDGDDEVDDHLEFPGRQGCGIPCYWSKRTPKHKSMYGSCCSPSLSDTLRRKGSIIFCGSQNIYPRRRQSSSGSHKQRIASRSAQGVLPLLTNSGEGRGGSSLGTGRSDDELSTNFGELDLEALSRLDGRRWSSSCRSQEGLEIVTLNGGGEEEGSPENIRSFSQKYKPMFFGELVGQNIVVQSLINAIERGRIAPVYLFQGPRGTGKTSAARIFTASLNCLAPDETKPCGYCRECSDFVSGKNKDLLEVDGTNKKGIDKVRYLLKTLSMAPPSASSRYKVFVIDECHLLPSKTWLAFLKYLEEPPQRVVFIFITTDLDNVPRTIQSRCQKYLFNKIKDSDIVARLRKISAEENLDVETDALELIALNADGSLRDAETMLDQLSLLGKRISTSLVNELVGVVSDEKLLELLELAMSSDTAETVKRARELMDSGVDPMVLMSQLASLIMDIIAGTYNINDVKHDSFFGDRNLTEAELERLKHALKILSEAEKQLRVSSERSTWFTATLLQLGSMPSPDLTHSCSRRHSCKTTEDDSSSASREAASYKQLEGQYMLHKSTSHASLQKTLNGNSNHQRDSLSRKNGFGFNTKPSHGQIVESGASTPLHDEDMAGNVILRCVNSEKLEDVWAQCIERCHSKTLRQLLHSHGKLVSISEAEGVLVAYVAFEDGSIKSRAERFVSSITNSMEVVLRRNVEVRIVHLPGGEAFLNGPSPAHLPGTVAAIDRERKRVGSNATDGYSNCSLFLDGTRKSTSDSSDVIAEGNAETSATRERRQEIPMQRIESIIRDQRLETAWLQVAEKGTPGSLSRLKPEKNQVLPQDGIYYEDQMESLNSMRLSSQQWEDGLNHEVKILKVNSGRDAQKDQTGRKVDRYPMSPSLLHDSNFVGNSNKDNLGDESGSGRGCSGFFHCYNTKPRKRGKVKGTAVAVQPRKGRRLSLFGECGKKSRKTESRHTR
ncbi:PREDICTED: STICHEL [Prunus dulcis]|uniref:PREDICTED: STICHEL n=1 Tax=Prunus dulcis TaxID=3755 RepID=A0A5E4FI73_PRUDU|nr:protein STICHEL [Prunus dulcis]VVA26920.1 PREDICTED: STICHEL [Prunus dulcis]